MKCPKSAVAMATAEIRHHVKMLQMYIVVNMNYAPPVHLFPEIHIRIHTFLDLDSVSCLAVNGTVTSLLDFI